MITRIQSAKVLASLALLLLTEISHARDYGRQYSQVAPEVKSWIENLANGSGILCCATADGVTPEMWEIGAEHYRVKIYGRWVTVPNSAVIRGPNRLGHAVVWLELEDESDDPIDALEPIVRCFLPGWAG